MGDTDTNDPFGSTSELLRKIDPDELRRMAEDLQVLVTSPGWDHLSRFLRLEREFGVRRMTAGKVLEHVEYAHTSGMVRGLAAPYALVKKVSDTHKAVQAALAREQRQDGES